MTKSPDVVAAELGRVSGLSKIMLFPEGNTPPGMWVRPSRLIAKPEKVRMVHDSSNPPYGLDGELWNL